MTSASQPKRRGGRRKMKQMQGLLMLSRLDEAAHQSGKTRHAKPQRVTVVLQPQLLELAYSALDKDKATTDAWFFAVYTAITEYERLPIDASEDVGHKFSAVLTSSLRDEATEVVVSVCCLSYEISHAVDADGLIDTWWLARDG
ncbi:hypothetical protein BBJ28_00008818 [Nothophytophthora sp. Chile5]|nr:hypothetical protein BBJ28_00008818 [Nothophytophthora sp. Chile5]